jgi:hypothetical protein
MSNILDRIFALEVAKGLVAKHSTINKFGRSTNVDNGVMTDIWDRANATDDDDIWTAPTQARTHDIASSSTSDDGDPAGIGARTIRIYGLKTWDDAAETTEDITMDGTSNVATSNTYVIIYRMRVLTKGATNVNVGNITATAQTDGTVTAQINAGAGQTQMAVFGVPSTQKLYIFHLYGSVLRSAGASGAVDMSMLVNPEPDTELLNFNTRHTFGLSTTGTSAYSVLYNPPKIVTGPAIVKVQGVGTANDLDVSGGFDGIIVDN